MIIITPYYARSGDKNFENRQQYLLQTLLSVDKQKLPKYTHIIVDDGSTDNFCAKLKSKLPNDNRIWLRREKGNGEIFTCTNALNFGIGFVLDNSIKFKDSESITFLHSDDLAIDLEIRDCAMKKSGLDFMYSDALIFFDNKDLGFRWGGLPFDQKFLEERFWIEGKMPYPTMTWKVSFLKQLLVHNSRKYRMSTLLDPNVGCGEDVDVALTTLEFAKEIDAKVEYLPRITSGYRIHNKSLASIRDRGERRKEENSVLYKHFGCTKSMLMHLKRFFTRPETYINFLMKLKNRSREHVKFSDYIAYNIKAYEKKIFTND